MEEGVGCSEGGAKGYGWVTCIGVGLWEGYSGSIRWVKVVSYDCCVGNVGAGAGAVVDSGNPCGPVDVWEKVRFKPLGEGRGVGLVDPELPRGQAMGLVNCGPMHISNKRCSVRFVLCRPHKPS